MMKLGILLPVIMILVIITNESFALGNTETPDKSTMFEPVIMLSEHTKTIVSYSEYSFRFEIASYFKQQSVTVNGKTLICVGCNSFRGTSYLVPGNNSMKIIAYSNSFRSVSMSFNVVYEPVKKSNSEEIQRVRSRFADIIIKKRQLSKPKPSNAFESGNFALAYSEYLNLANQGNTEAEYYVGFMNRRGLGVKKNLSTAARLLLKSASKENMDAQYELARLYATGFGGPERFIEAEKWYYLAAIQGHLQAQVDIGELYFVGDKQGVPLHYGDAEIWLSAGAQGGNTDAMWMLYQMKKISIIKLELYRLEKNLNFLDSDIDPYFLNLSIIEAENWLKKAAKMGNKIAQKYCVKDGLSYE